MLFVLCFFVLRCFNFFCCHFTNKDDYKNADRTMLWTAFVSVRRDEGRPETHSTLTTCATDSTALIVGDMSLIGCDIRRSVRINDATVGVGGATALLTVTGECLPRSNSELFQIDKRRFNFLLGTRTPLAFDVIILLTHAADCAIFHARLTSTTSRSQWLWHRQIWSPD